MAFRVATRKIGRRGGVDTEQLPELSDPENDETVKDSKNTRVETSRETSRGKVSVNTVPVLVKSGRKTTEERETLKAGERGPKGPKGEKGDQGPQGEKGDAGDSGSDGKTAMMFSNTVTLPSEMTRILLFPFDGAKFTMENIYIVVRGSGSVSFDLRDATSGDHVVDTIESDVDGVSIVEFREPNLPDRLCVLELRGQSEENVVFESAEFVM